MALPSRNSVRRRSSGIGLEKTKSRSVRAKVKPSLPSFDNNAQSVSLSHATTFDEVVTCDILILGSGIAGLTCALEAAKVGTTKVVLVTKDKLLEGSTRYAQGGVAAVMQTPSSATTIPKRTTTTADDDDTPDKADRDSVVHHMEDTMNAGCYLNDRKAVEIMCKEGPKQVEMLCQIGVPFTTLKKKKKKNESHLGAEKELHLGKEGGHSHPRVVHAADTTGAAIMETLVQRVKEHPNIQVHEHAFALDLLATSIKRIGKSNADDGDDDGEEVICYGCEAVNFKQDSYTRFVSKCTVIATGGCGQIYPKTTNPYVATGDGIAMAARVGATVENMEFVQFHPTSLYVAKEDAKGDDVGAEPPSGGGEEANSSSSSLSSVFLISEAVRGAGAVLRNAKGEAFMKEYDPRADLAPRDIVARGIYDQMRIHNTEHVYLDVTHLSKEQVEEEFPHISSHVKDVLGISMSESYVPVVPAQHYSCGGILTNTRGETDVKGLYAIGESACTGVHGANRLASNSLLEGLVFGKRAVASALVHMQTVEYPTDLVDPTTVKEFHNNHACSAKSNAADGDATFPRDKEVTATLTSTTSKDQQALVEKATMKRLARVKSLMWKYAGIRRSDKDLQTGLRKVRELKVQLQREEEEATARRYNNNSSKATTAVLSCSNVELVNMVDVAELVFIGAIKREASAGLHWNVDRPEEKKKKKHPAKPPPTTAASRTKVALF
jgi:L-aspartate oxidase